MALIVLVSDEVKIHDLTKPPKCALHPESNAIVSTQVVEGVEVDFCLTCHLSGVGEGTVTRAFKHPNVTVLRHSDAMVFFATRDGGGGGRA